MYNCSKPLILDGGHGDGGGDPSRASDDGYGGCSSPAPAREYGPNTFSDLVAENTTALARSILELSDLFKHAREVNLDGEIIDALLQFIDSVAHLIKCYFVKG
nr:hypothetical protein Iba_chr13cCG7150 [Ipomoea batatas]